jgi:hypothetical protein
MESIDRRLLLAGAGLAGVAAMARLAKAGPLDPDPGPISPTGRTLQQIHDKIARGGDHGTAEARVPVQSLPGSASAQYVISQPGVYCLVDNITGEPGKSAVDIQCDHVELECDGFTFFGAQGTLACVRAIPDATGPRRCIGVYDAGFHGWSGECCDFSSAEFCCVEECWFDSCSSLASDGRVGVCCAMGRGGVMYDCDARRCVGGMCSIESQGSIEECVCADGIGGAACFFSPGDCVMEDNFAMNCDGTAFVVQNRGVLQNNRCVQCAGGADCGPASVVASNDLDVVSASGGAGITIRGNRCCVDDNYVSGGGIVVLAGGDGTLIESNHVVGPGGTPGTGGGVIFIEQGVTRCCVMCNHIRNASTTSAFMVPATNSYGPVCLVAGGGDVSLVQSSSHPWTNFVY